ncbi:muscle calcium channel subunit alpha-1-like isoform X2 [Clytia hemisphaerica]|uniref:muscle calcium channel subunit alpha-1-like isoform X2 n=1 Tax=Clytia hemisphaerica TaxID=252671 RepID=UPI0034D3F3AB
MERPNTLSIAKRGKDETTPKYGVEEEQYIQLKPLAIHKSYSEPNILSPKVDQLGGEGVGLSDRRSYSSPYILEGYQKKKSLTDDIPVKKEYYALFCLSPSNPIRRLAINITEAKLFDYFILMTILFSCIVMAIDAPLPENDKSSMNVVAGQIEYYLLGIFGFEALLRIIAMGFIMHPHSYLRSVWNVLDFVVVIFGIVTLDDIFISESGFNIKALRMVRVLRPLKLISGIPSLQVVMMSIVRAIVPLLQVLFLVVFVIIIFSIIGLEFLYDRFHYSCWSAVTKSFDGLPCDKNIDQRKYFTYGRRCPVNTTCEPNWPGLNHGITNFDNIFLSIITVFQCLTMEGWSQVMYYTFYNADEYGYIYAFYYITLIVIGSFFMLNLVLGVLSGEFAKEREKVENRRAFLKLRQENLISSVCESYLNWISKGEDIMILEEKPAESHHLSSSERGKSIYHAGNHTGNGNVIVQTYSNGQLSTSSENNQSSSKLDQLKLYIKKLRVKLKHVVKHEYFFWLVISMVAINTVIMATKHYEQPDWLTNVQSNAENVFVVIFTFEMLLKIFAHGFFGYCRSLFNIFDVIVVLLSILELILRRINDNFSYGLSVLRCLRLLRAFKVTKYWSSLRNLVASLMNAMNAILSLIFLLFLFIVIWSLLGMQLFGGRFVKLETLPRTNFDTFKDAFLTVFQVITGEDWNAVMYDGMRVYGATSATGIAIAFIYFFFLVIFGNYTLLNVFLAIAVDNLTNAEILTHDEEAAESKRMTNNIQQAFEYDETLGMNALSFVNNLQARVEGERLSIRASEQSSFDQQDGDENSLSNEELPPAIENGHAGNETTSIQKDTLPVIIQNGNPLTPENLMRKRKSQGMFDQILLEIPGKGTVAAFNPPQTQEGKYMQSVQKKWRSIVEMSNEQPERFTHENHLENNNRPSIDGGMEIRSLEQTSPYSSEGFNGYNDNDDDDEEEDVEEEIKQKGMLNVLKFNVGNRRRILKKKPIVQQNSLFLLSPSNRFRRICHNIVHFRYFDWIIMLVILMSSITLAIEDPVHDDAPRNEILQYFDYFFTTVFGLEVILKVIDRGLVLHKRAYLRSFWNCLDAFVFACNLTSIILAKTAIGSNQSTVTQIVRILRVLRVLRPLKTIQRVRKLKVVFQCMIYSLKNVTFVLIITYLILFIFACIGVQLFQGKFYYCTDPSKITKEECQGSFYKFESATSVADNDPEVKERKWTRQRFHFDNIYEAFLTLYISSTGEGWPGSMHNTIDATQIGQGPVVNNNPHMFIYYFVFVVIFTFMIINIYIALIILTFQRQGEKEIEGGLDRNQRDCLQFVLNASPQQRFMPSDKKSLSYHVWYVVDSKPFEYFIMLLIVLNSVQLMMKYNKMSESYASMLTALNLTFTVLFCIEAALKLTAYGLNYFRDLWNVFDLLVILGSCADLIIFFNESEFDFIDVSTFRLCRAARIVKLLRKGESIRIMLWTFLQSFKALPYVTVMLLLLFYIYAIIGMQMFGKIALGKVNVVEIHEYNNFRGLIQALQVLFRTSTGESWNNLMYECYSHALCDKAIATKDNETCGNTIFAQMYFTTFIFFSMFLLLNLFVAVIMDNFEYLTRDQSILGPHHLQEFVRCWSEFDPQATGTIHHEKVFNVLCQLSPPVGFGKQCPREIAYKRLIRMNMPVDKDGVSVAFHTTLLALIRTSLDIYVSGNMFDNDKELRRVMESIWPKDCHKHLSKLLPKMKGNGKQLTIGKMYCVKLIILKYRRSKGKQSLTTKKEHSPSVLTRLNSLLPSLRRHLSQRSSVGSHEARKSSEFLNVSHQNIRKINSFGGRTKSQNEHHTRDGQLRRRSSWSDLPSFFKFNSKENSASTSELNTSNKDDTHSLNGSAKNSTSSTPVSNTSTNTNGRNGRLSPNYNRTGPKNNNNNNNKAPFNRTGSLRTNSNGNVVGHHHRKSSNNNFQSLQYEPSKGNGRYSASSNKSNKYHNQPHSNSAPTTPRGSHASGIPPSTRQALDYRLSNQGSPLPRRQQSNVPFNQSNSNQHLHHRRGQSHPDQFSARDQQQSQQMSNSYDYQNNEQNMGARSRSMPDQRKGPGPVPIPQHRKETSSLENLDSYHYGNHPQQQYDPYREQNMGRSVRHLQESRSLPNKSVYSQPPTHSGHYNNNANSDNRPNYHPPNKNSDMGFRPIDSNYQQQQQPRDNNYPQYSQASGGSDLDYRNSPGDMRRPASQPTSSSSPLKQHPHLQQSNNFKRNDYGGSANHISNDKSRDSYKLQSSQLEPAKRDRGSVSPRQMQPPQLQSGSGRYSPVTYYDNELMNGTPSKQYYDNMISQINDQIARVSEGNVPTQPFNATVQNTVKALEDDDNEWC